MRDAHQSLRLVFDRPGLVDGLDDACVLAATRRIVLIRTHLARRALQAIFSQPWQALCLVVMVLLGQTGLNGQDTDYTIPQLVEEMSPGVVSIAIVDRDGNVLTRGSGFIADSSGLIVTAYHLIDGARYATVTTVDGEIYDRMDVVEYDRRRDVAIIHIRPFSALRALRLASTDDLVIGEDAVAIGNPQGLDHTVSSGLISGYRQMTGFRLIQTTAPISPGSSGGPLITMDGSVVGITNYQLSTDRTQNLNFAIPITYVQTLLDRSSTSGLPLDEFARSMEGAPVLPDTTPSRSDASAWRVIHDHASSTFRFGCRGELLVTAQGIRFIADGSTHSFLVSWATLGSISRKPEWGSGAFTVLVRGTQGTFNFKFVTDGTGETELRDLLEIVDRLRR